MNKATFIVCAVATAILPAPAVLAGDWGKAPAGKSPIEECADLGGEISIGYDTDYVFYGVRFAKDSVWVDVNYTFDDFAVPVKVGVWYLNAVSGPAVYDELDVYIDFALGTFAGFDFNVGYYHYTLPELGGGFGYGEAYLDISRSLGFVDLSYSAIKAFGSKATSAGWFHELGLERTIELTDAVSLILGGGVGYSDGYYDGNTYGLPRDSGWNHYYFKASLPITLNCRTTLTPYIGYNGATRGMIADGIDVGLGPQSDILHGGVSLTVSF